LVRSNTRRSLDVRLARLPRNIDDVAPLEIAFNVAGSYRLFAACRNPHYASVAVTWIDAVVH
jgi:hypothetical protein